MKLVHFNTFGPNGSVCVSINIENISIIIPDGEMKYCTDIYMVGDEDPIIVDSTYDEVITKINEY